MWLVLYFHLIYSVNEFMQALDCALTTMVLFTGRRWRSAGFQFVKLDHSACFHAALTISFTSSEVRVLPLAKSLLGYSLPG